MNPLLMCWMALFLWSATTFSFGNDLPGVTSAAALQKLIEGNKRYVAAKESSSKQTQIRREEIAKAQHPFAVILGCSDSRVSPEIVFDQNLGDLFVIRVAGNIVDDHVLGSIEYAVEHLGVHLIFILGHERCGAVDAALKGGEAPGHIQTLIEAIKPAVENTKALPGDRLENTICENMFLVDKQLRESKPILAHEVKEGKLQIVQGYYDLETGKITVVSELKAETRTEH